MGHVKKQHFTVKFWTFFHSKIAQRADFYSTVQYSILCNKYMRRGIQSNLYYDCQLDLNRSHMHVQHTACPEWQ